MNNYYILEPTRCFQQRGIRKVTAEKNVIAWEKNNNNFRYPNS